jgi:PAS domain S-box-containing protein
MSEKIKNKDTSGNEVRRETRRRKQTSGNLMPVNDRYHSLFNDVPIALLEEDFSVVKKHLDELRSIGIKNFNEYFQNDPQELAKYVDMVRIVDANQAALKLFHAESKRKLLRGLRQIFTEDTYDAFKEQIIALAGGAKFFEKERAIRTLDGEGRYVHLELSIASGFEDTWERALLSMANITVRKQAEEGLRLSEARLTEAQRIAHLGNWDWNVTTNKLMWSDEIYRIFGLAKRESGVTYNTFLNSVHPDDRELVEQSVNEALYERQPYDINHRVVLPSGTVRIVHEKGEIFFDNDNQPLRMVGTVQDITELKRIENELRLLSRSLVRIQEEERRTIARELHDEIGQSLTVLKLILDRAKGLPNRAASSTLTEAEEVVNGLMEQVRKLSLELRPGMLDDLGLLPTLLWHFDNYTKKTFIKVNFKHSGLQVPFSSEVMVTAYRIVQEALTNILRHAGVTEIDVTAWTDQQMLWIRIEDRGKGFNPESISPGTSGGLFGMYERASSLDGELTVDSAPGQGTTIVTRLPLFGNSTTPKEDEI